MVNCFHFIVFCKMSSWIKLIKIRNALNKHSFPLDVFGISSSADLLSWCVQRSANYRLSKGECWECVSFEHFFLFFFTSSFSCRYMWLTMMLTTFLIISFFNIYIWSIFLLFFAFRNKKQTFAEWLIRNTRYSEFYSYFTRIFRVRGYHKVRWPLQPKKKII